MNKKGITLVSLVTMIVLIMLIMGSMTYVSVNALDIKEGIGIKSDLRILTDKIQEYYLKTGSLPIKESFLYNVDISVDELPKRNKYDGIDYHAINYDLLGGVNLNNSDRAYLVNETTHTVYVLDGFNASNSKEYHLPYVYNINAIE